MTRRPLPLILALALAAALPERIATEQPQAPVLAPELAARAASTPVRVVVRLDAGAVAGEGVGAPAIAAIQRRVLADADFLADVTRFETIPAFAATTDLAGLNALAALPDVIGIEEDLVLLPALSESTALVGADVLWSQGTEGAGWAVAVLDTGVTLTSSAYTGKIVSEACYSTTDVSNGTISLCPNGASSSIASGSAAACAGCTHGDQVAGVAVARTRTVGTTSISGVARGANLIPIKVVSTFNSADLCAPAAAPCIGAFASDITRGLERMFLLASSGVAGNIAAVTVPLATPAQTYSSVSACDNQSPTLKQAIDSLRSLGVPTIVPAGNSGRVNELAFPACVSTAIGVGATTKLDAIATFSNRSALLKLVAPGAQILTFTAGTVAGTSAAAGHVAGAWALLKSRSPNATVDTVLQALQQTAVQITDRDSGLTLPRIRIDRAALVLGTSTAAPTGVTVQTSGSQVTVTWGPPSDGSTPASYFVEITLTPGGQAVAAVNVGTARNFVINLPDGTYAVRVRAISPSGVSTASNDVPFQVGTTPNTNVPPPPVDLRVSLFDNVVTLTWNTGGSGPAATGYVVDVGSAPSLSNFGSFDTGSTATTLTAAPPTAGTYYVRVRARNAFGVSGPSNEALLVVGGGGPCSGAPLPPSNLVATVQGSLVTLSWGRPLTSGAISGYTLEAGTAPGVSDVANAPLGVTTIFSGVASPGVYYVRVRANNACGASPSSNEVQVVVP